MDTTQKKMQFLSKEELIRKIHTVQKYRTSASILLLVLAVVFIVAFMKMDHVFLLLLACAGIYILFKLYLSFRWYQTYETFSISLDPEEVCPQILCATLREQFQSVTFQPEASLPEAVLKAPPFPFTEDDTSYVGRNYASAYCGSTQIELCQALFGQAGSVQYTESDDHTTKSGSYRNVTVLFDGLFYVCHTQANLPATTVMTRGKHEPTVSATGDSAFDRAFSVHSDRPETVSTTLSKTVRNALLAGAEKIEGNLYLHFSPDGTIYVAVHDPIFDMHTKSGEQAFDRMETELRMIAELIHMCSAQ